MINQTRSIGDARKFRHHLCFFPSNKLEIYELTIKFISEFNIPRFTRSASNRRKLPRADPRVRVRRHAFRVHFASNSSVCIMLRNPTDVQERFHNGMGFNNNKWVHGVNPGGFCNSSLNHIWKKAAIATVVNVLRPD